MSSSLSILGDWVIDFAWIATILLAVAVVMRLALRDPGGRVLLAWGTWLSILTSALLALAPCWPRYDVADLILPRHPEAPIVFATGDQPRIEPLILLAPTDTTERLLPLASDEAQPVTIAWPQLLAGVWLAMAIMALGWIAFGLIHVCRLLRNSQAAPNWIVRELRLITASDRAAVDVRTSRQLSSAVAVGAIWPRIVLPEPSAVETNLKAVRAALAHEWAHIRHGDLRLLVLERLLIPLLAMHPLFWWLRRQTRLDQELLADAAAAGDKPVEYAEALVAWARAAPPTRMGLEALAMWERPSNLSRRVHMVLTRNHVHRSRFGRLVGLASIVLLLALAGSLTTLTLSHLNADDELAADATDPPLATATEVEIDGVPVAIEPATADVEAEQTDAELTITLGVSLFALDRAEFPETKKQVMEVVEQAAGKELERIPNSSTSSLNSNHSPAVLAVEIDQRLEQRLTGELRSIEGVKLLSRGTIITLNGHVALLRVAEKNPQVFIEREIDGQIEREEQIQPGPVYTLAVKSRIQNDDGRLSLTIEAARQQSNLVQPKTEVKKTAGLGKTLVIISSEPYAILISPTKVEKQAGSAQSLQSSPLSQQPLPSLTPSARASTAAQPPVALPARVPTLPPATRPLAGNAMPAQLAPSTRLPSPPALTTTPYPTPALAGELPAGSPRRPASDPATTPLPADVDTITPTLPSAERRARQTQRKLLELDLAAAKLELEAAEVELTEAQALRQKSLSTISQQELRKRQLQVERAKIQVQRIEVHLEAEGKPGEEPQTTRPRSRTTLGCF